jgi:hypothetical protein
MTLYRLHDVKNAVIDIGGIASCAISCLPCSLSQFCDGILLWEIEIVGLWDTKSSEVGANDVASQDEVVCNAMA